MMYKSIKQLLFVLASAARLQEQKGNTDAAIALWTARKAIKELAIQAKLPF